MKKLQLIAPLAILLLFASTGNAQFNAILYNLTPLTDLCTAGSPLPSSCLVAIYWDNDANGPDTDDPQPPVGDCYACANYVSFPLNGEEMLGIPGTFMTDPAFTIVTTTPNPSRYYLRVNCNAALLWTSRVFTIQNGLNEYDLSEGWSCLQLDDPCDNYFNISYEDMTQDPNNHRHYTYSACIEFCADQPAYLHSFDFPLGGGGGIATLTPGCGTESPCNSDENLTYAYPLWENGTNTVMLHDYSWDTWIPMVSPVSGWACMYIDIVLPVSQGSFDAIAGDERVSLNWNTLAETAVDYFVISRQSGFAPAFIPVAEIPAENSPSGASYSFVDRNVTNGETYIYRLKTVNIDGSIQEWGVEVTATPHAEIITEYALHQNYPNPFNPATRIEFDVLEDNPVTLQVFNVNGRLVATPVNGNYPAGRHTITLDAAGLSAGVYFYTVRIGDDFTSTRKMLLLK